MAVNPFFSPDWLGNLGGGGGGGMSINPFAMMGAGGGGGMGGGGGWLENIGKTLMGPGGIPVGIGMQLIGGILSGLSAAHKRKKKKGMQKDYISEARRLFPELSPQQFQYQNPAVANALQGFMGNRMMNMTGWGMPAGMGGGPDLAALIQTMINTPAYPRNPMSARMPGGN